MSSARRAMTGIDPKTAPKNVCANHAPSVSVGGNAGGFWRNDAAGVPDVGDDSAGAARADADADDGARSGTGVTGQRPDDELPRGRTLKISWTKKSGPGTVTFTSMTTPATRAKFSAVGAYELVLSATDGDRSTTRRSR